MTKPIDAAQWVYVVVQNPGKGETIVGQHDADHNINFIPVFKDRDTALQGVTQMVKEPGQAFEIQAIIYEDLLHYAVEGRFLLFFLDGSGHILSKVGPDGQPI